MTLFIGRSAELRALQDGYEAAGGALVPVYGRRRVGKSALILEFLRTRPGVYYMGKRAPANMQQREFLREAAGALGEPLLAGQAPGDWRSILSTVVCAWKGDGRLIIALDEFQWMVEASPELPSVLQELWDRQWKRDGRVMVILCGSFMGFMERELLGRKSPLFGRRTAQIHLRPFGHLEAAQFHPGWSVTDQAMAYFVCGGIPQYLEYFDTRRSVAQNIERQVLNPTAPLWSEPDFLLREELREVERYYTILWAIAGGSMTPAQIARQIGLDPRAMDYYLRQLVELGYIVRRHPLTGQKPNPRITRYALEDPLLRFWFRFVYPNASYAMKMGAEAAFRERVRPHLDSYYGSCFERLCREAMPELYRREGVRAEFEVGEYWSDQVQIDVVALREDGRTDLGECKWGRSSASEAAEELRVKAQRFPNARGATLGLHLFMHQRPPRAAVPEGIVLHTLDELYGRT